MPQFVKFILVLIVVAMCATLGLVFYTSHHIKTWQVANAKRERAAVDAKFGRLDKKFRRADLVVLTQTIGGDKSVQATTLVMQPWGIDKNGTSSVPLTPQIVKVDGGAPVVVIRSLKFAEGFRFDDDDVSDYSGIVAGRTIYLFDQVQSSNAQGEEKTNASHAEVPLTCQVDPAARPSGYENALWHRIWNLARDPARALHGGLREEKFESLPTEVRPGMVYQVWIEGADRPNIREVDDPKEVAAMLSAANQKPAQPSE